jgi:hypothetical protein
MFSKLEERLGAIATLLKPAYAFAKELLPRWHHSPANLTLHDDTPVVGSLIYNEEVNFQILNDYNGLKSCDQYVKDMLFYSGLKINPGIRCRDDVWDSFIGIKDGVVYQTGELSKIYQCNTNITEVGELGKAWAETLQDLGARFDVLCFEAFQNDAGACLETGASDPLIASTKKDPLGERVFDTIEDSLRWPFELFHSCYWAMDELVFRSDQDEVDINLGQFLGEAWNEPGLAYFSEVLTNALFNLGFIIQDVRYVLALQDSEPDWFYRNGFVIGDIYMRFFFRSLASAPLRLIYT